MPLTVRLLARSSKQWGRISGNFENNLVRRSKNESVSRVLIGISAQMAGLGARDWGRPVGSTIDSPKGLLN